MRSCYSIAVHAGTKLHDEWKRVKNVCFCEEGLGNVGLQTRLIDEQPHGEINFCVQAVSLSLCTIWCLIFKGAGAVREKLNWTETNITSGKERHFFYRTEPMGTLSAKQKTHAVPSLICLGVSPN